MAELKLTGKYPVAALVDDSDLPLLLSACAWWATLAENGQLYVYGSPPGAERAIGLHTFLMGSRPGQEIDHRDGNSLNNQRSNLRFCTHAENMRNRRKNRSSTSRFKGVSFDNTDKVWRPAIRLNGKRKWLGRFRCEVAAAREYDQAALRLHGEFARTNEMLGLL